jgi:hypothetical protein
MTKQLLQICAVLLKVQFHGLLGPEDAPANVDLLPGVASSGPHIGLISELNLDGIEHPHE